MTSGELGLVQVSPFLKMRLRKIADIDAFSISISDTTAGPIRDSCFKREVKVIQTSAFDPLLP